MCSSEAVRPARGSGMHRMNGGSIALVPTIGSRAQTARCIRRRTWPCKALRDWHARLRERRWRPTRVGVPDLPPTHSRLWLLVADQVWLVCHQPGGATASPKGPRQPSNIGADHSSTGPPPQARDSPPQHIVTPANQHSSSNNIIISSSSSSSSRSSFSSNTAYGPSLACTAAGRG